MASVLSPGGDFHSSDKLNSRGPYYVFRCIYIFISTLYKYYYLLYKGALHQVPGKGKSSWTPTFKVVVKGNVFLQWDNT